MPIVREILAKSILNRSKVADYCINAYTGCEHNCRYCYARLFMRRYSGHKEPWGDFVDAKINAPDVLNKQLRKAKRGTVWVSSVCDPYQPLEATFGLTRRCLEELLRVQFPVNIQTKSSLVVRDRDLFQQFEDIDITLTIATDREKMARLFEPKASPLRDRLEALEVLCRAGVKTSVFIGPILPGNPDRLASLLEGLVGRALIDRMNYLSSIKGFYKAHNLEFAATSRFFNEYKIRIVKELRKKGIKVESIF